MTRVLAVLAALVAVSLFAPLAQAAPITIVVNDNGDAPDATPGDRICDSDPGAPVACTLRAAIQTANENVTPDADTIHFGPGGQAPAPLTALPPVTQPVSIDGQGTVTVTFGTLATGNLLDLQAANILVKSIAFTGGGSGVVVNLGATGDRLDTVNVHDVAGTAIRIAGGSGRVDGSQVRNAGGTGIAVTGATATLTSPTISGGSGVGILAGGSNVSINSPTISGTAASGIQTTGSGGSISSPEISGAGADGVSLGGSAISVSGGRIHNNAGNGVGISGQQDVVSRVTLYGNGAKAIATASGANGGIGAPANLRIGPRRADGSLPLTGTANRGTLELWSGDPGSASAPGFVDAFRVSGDFAYNFPSEPAPGSVFAVSQTGDGLGTGEFALVSVPGDVASPDVTFSRALDTSTVRVDFSEPIDPASLQKDDFKLSMAGVERQVGAVTPSPDGRFATLTATSAWRAGEAGFIDVTAAGAVNDANGNAMLSTPHMRVAAAPGDFIAPLGGSLKLIPKTICLTRGRHCRKPGLVIKFTTTETGKARMLIKRSNKTIGSRLYANIVPGTNTLKFNGRLGARKLRAGRYRLLIYVQDAVGNITDQPPIQLFSVRRTTK